jgi:hypothetical protein
MTVFQLNLPEKITAELAAEGITKKELDAFLVAAIEAWLARRQSSQSSFSWSNAFQESAVAFADQLIEENQNLFEELAQPSTLIFQRILARATDMGISDLSQRHDHYLHGVVEDEPSQ